MQEIINTIATTGTPLYILHEILNFITAIALLFVIYKVGIKFAESFKVNF